VSLAKREAEAGQLSEFSLLLFLVAGSGCVCVCLLAGMGKWGEESLRRWVAKSL